MADGSPLLDVAAVEAVAARYRLALPRSAYDGRIGGVLGRQAGGSMELQDFRAYQPGDDVRHVDWNAAARTDQLYVRVRREEVSPVVEVVVDASKSMALTPEKAARTRTLAWAFCRIAKAQGLEPVLVRADDTPLRLRPPTLELVTRLTFESTQTLPALASRGLPLRPCGLRIVISDLLFETTFDTFAARFARDSALLVLVQPLDPSEVEPPEGALVELVDTETGERLERPISPLVIQDYRARLARHQSAIETATRRVHGTWAALDVAMPLESAFRGALLGRCIEARP